MKKTVIALVAQPSDKKRARRKTTVKSLKVHTGIKAGPEPPIIHGYDQ